MPQQRFTKQMRLLARGDFRRVYERRCWLGDDLLRLAGELSELPQSRLGLAVSRQVGNAVARNRWKRLIREAFRLNGKEFPGGLDFVVVPREGAKAELQSITKSLTSLSWRLVKRLKREQSLARRNARQERENKIDPDS